MSADAFEAEDRTSASAPSAVRLSVALVLVSLVVGAAAGLAWYLVAPRVVLQVRGETAVPAGFQPGEFIAADASLALLLSGCGLLVAGVAMWRYRSHPLVVLAAGAVGGLLGSLVAWRIGAGLGAVDVEAMVAAGPDGATFEGPLQLRVPAVLVLWPLMVAVVVTIVALWDVIIAWQERRYPG